MSLGDIIKLNRSLKKGQGARGDPGRARLPGGQGGGTGSFRNPGSGSGVKSRRETGRIQKSKFAWGNTGRFQKSKSKSNGENGPARVMVCNLDYGVSDTDIEELFKACGMMRKANVHFDSFGFSLGTADVIFKYRDDAIKAIKKFQGILLDGRPMKLHLLMGANDVEHNSFEPHPFKPRPFKSRPFKSDSIKPRSQDDGSTSYSSSRLVRDPYRVSMGQQKYKYI
ncbi:hypothetical protein M5D96_003940 [Drosophila gunungcola]|uniref:RRM domain-containing protein n=1 Tax=Drosophila gunungcola TaxID=103775 RepID=A0A9P9YT60_9MUSC|nr:hypothetical protein M5D96_003940 [Drosophila gunungcola]